MGFTESLVLWIKKLSANNTVTVLIQREMFYWLLYYRVFERVLSGKIWKLGAIVDSFHREWWSDQSGTMSD